MLPWKRKKEIQETGAIRVGLSIGSSTLTLVACDVAENGASRILHWDTQLLDESQALDSSVRQFVDKHKLQGHACRAVLSPADYSLRLVERPANVPDEELNEATRWLVRDLIEFDVDTAQIATITIPEDAGRARTPRMFVVAVREEAISRLCSAVQQTGLELEGVDIIETAMIALESRMPDVVAGRAVLRVGGKSSTLTVSFDEHLYLARSLSIDSDSIEQAVDGALAQSDPSSRDTLDLLDPLLLEIQRSLDYYESEYGLAPASRLTLLPSKNDYSPLLPVMTEALRPLQVEVFDVDRFFGIENPPLASMQSDLILAAGAALASPSLLGDSLTPESLRARSDTFGLPSVLKLCAAVLLFAATVYGWNAFQIQSEDAELTRLEIQQDALQAEYDERLEAQSLSSGRTDPQSVLEGLRSVRDSRIATLRDLQRGSSASDAPFSSMLDALSRQDSADVWLERIELSQGGDALQIEGRALLANNVPAFLRRLSNEAAFAARSFRTLDIARPDDASLGLTFLISTESRLDGNGGAGE